MKDMVTKRAGRFLTLKDMTGGSGCTPRTVRYYEREGLLQAARTSGGHRLFAPGELDRLNFILSLREAGCSLEEITGLLGTRSAAPTDREAQEQIDATLEAQIRQLERKIDVLTRLQTDLKESRQSLAVCGTCTREAAKVPNCDACPQLPPLSQLPHGFRLTWRGPEARESGPADNGRSLRVHTDDTTVDIDS